MRLFASYLLDKMQNLSPTNVAERLRASPDTLKRWMSRNGVATITNGNIAEILKAYSQPATGRADATCKAATDWLAEINDAERLAKAVMMEADELVKLRRKAGDMEREIASLTAELTTAWQLANRTKLAENLAQNAKNEAEKSATLLAEMKAFHSRGWFSITENDLINILGFGFSAVAYQTLLGVSAFGVAFGILLSAVSGLTFSRAIRNMKKPSSDGDTREHYFVTVYGIEVFNFAAETLAMYKLCSIGLISFLPDDPWMWVAFAATLSGFKVILSIRALKGSLLENS